MKQRLRKPAFWLAIPVFIVALGAVDLYATFGWTAGIAAAATGALIVGWFAENRHSNDGALG